MIFNRSLIISAMLLLVLVARGSQANERKLQIGSKAPPILVEKWLKSSPVESFQQGKIYVVEFWATWCPPCRESIPHLTNLSKKLTGKVIFTGVSIAEERKSDTDLGYVDVVRKFVKAQGAKMDYHVAVDRRDGFMAKSWMEAAGEQGIPTAFVIDRAGAVAWIGHPMQGLEAVLQQEVAGTYNLKAAAEARKRSATRQADLSNPQANGSIEALAKAVQNNDWKAAAKTCDVIFASDRTQEKPFCPIKFLALLQTDPRAAYSYGHYLQNGILKDSPAILVKLAQMVLSDEYGPKKPDLSFAFDIAKQSAELSKMSDPAVLDTLADAQIHLNDPAKALETEQLALKALGTSKDYAPEVLDQIKNQIQKHIQKIKLLQKE